MLQKPSCKGEQKSVTFSLWFGGRRGIGGQRGRSRRQATATEHIGHIGVVHREDMMGGGGRGSKSHNQIKKKKKPKRWVGGDVGKGDNVEMGQKGRMWEEMEGNGTKRR